jgi:hypothetical protein
MPHILETSLSVQGSRVPGSRFWFFGSLVLNLEPNLEPGTQNQEPENQEPENPNLEPGTPEP